MKFLSPTSIVIFSSIAYVSIAAGAIQISPLGYDSNLTPGGNAWYIDNSYTGSTSGGLSGGTGELVDGVKGTFISTGFAQWQPYSLIDTGNGGADVVYTYHFDQNYIWDSIIQYQEIFHKVAVYQPSGFDIEFSIDGGANYHSTVIRSMSVAENAVNKGVVQYSLLGSATGYHANTIRITLKQPTRWTATDEVEFFASGVVPEPSTYALLIGCAALGFTLSRRRATRNAPIALKARKTE